MNIHARERTLSKTSAAYIHGKATIGELMAVIRADASRQREGMVGGIEQAVGGIGDGGTEFVDAWGGL